MRRDLILSIVIFLGPEAGRLVRLADVRRVVDSGKQKLLAKSLLPRTTVKSRDRWLGFRGVGRWMWVETQRIVDEISQYVR